MSLKLKYNISQWDDLKLNYWGITKCGNTSVKYALMKASDKELDRAKKDHHGADSWVHKETNAKYIDIDTALSNGYKNFAVTRHPYDRFVSMYKDTQRRHDHFFKGKVRIKTIDDLIEFISPIPDARREVHFRSQSYFITKNERLIPTIIVDINNTSRISEVVGVELDHMNSIINNQIELSESQKQEIFRLYRRDFIILGYER